MSKFKSEMRRRLLECKNVPAQPIWETPSTLDDTADESNNNLDVARYNIPVKDTFLSSIEAIDIDDIVALVECGKQYSVEELVEQFGISVDAAKSVLAPCDPIDIAKAIAEAENAETIVSIFENADEHEAAEASDSALPHNESWDYSDEEFAQMVYELEHVFD